MTVKGKARWSGLWVWVALGVFLICTACGTALFGIYGHYFPDISGVRDDWNVFGALLGGFGSCIGAVATLATLLFLAHQNRKQQDFIEWQVYASHRQMFFEKLAGLQTFHDDSFRFHDPDTLYSALFPNNSPSRVELAVEPNRDEETGNFIGLLSKNLEKLDERLKDLAWKDSDAPLLVELLIEIAYDLGYKWLEDGADGDVIYHHKNYGINIYYLKEFVGRAKSIHKAFLLFTGNDAYDGFKQDNSGCPRDVLMRYFLERWQPKHGTSTLKLSSDVALFGRLFIASDLLRSSQRRIMPDTYLSLSNAFTSREGVRELRDQRKLKPLAATALEELNKAYEDGLVDGEHQSNPQYLRECLVLLAARL